MADDREERFERVVERMPRIAEAIAGFDPTLRERAYYSLLNVLAPDPVDPEPYVFDLLDALLSGNALNFGEHEVPAVVQNRLLAPLDRSRFVEREEYDRACDLVAGMHAAAVGEVRGPIRGVVEDVADLRARCLAAERGQPARPAEGA